MKHNSASEEQKLRFKADISNLKLLTNTLLVNSNKKENFYRNFFQNNQLPPTFYISQDDDRAMVRRLEELNPLEDEEDLQYDINMIRKLQGNTWRHHGKSILVTSRKKQINKIKLL